MSERYLSRIVVDLLLERMNDTTGKKEILLLLRQNTGYYDGMYDLPGGHLEAGEDLYDAMIREAKEEIGIRIKREDLKMIHICHRFHKGVLKFVFKAKKYEGSPTNAEPDHCKELKWVEINNLPENIIPKIKREIESVKESEFYCKDGELE